MTKHQRPKVHAKGETLLRFAREILRFSSVTSYTMFILFSPFSAAERSFFQGARNRFFLGIVSQTLPEAVRRMAGRQADLQWNKGPNLHMWNSDRLHGTHVMTTLLFRISKYFLLSETCTERGWEHDTTKISFKALHDESFEWKQGFLRSKTALMLVAFWFSSSLWRCEWF